MVSGKGMGTMLKSVILIAALAGVAMPNWALAQGNSNNTPASQNANGIPFTANDPPAASNLVSIFWSAFGGKADANRTR